MPFFIVENDITKMNTECIVVSADVSLHPVGGMSTALFDAVEEPENLLRECERIGFCGGCECVITRSYGLSSKYIIHSVAPLLADSNNRAEEYLKTCYKNAIYMARRKMFESLAVPLIGTGKKGYPKDMAVKIAMEVIENFLSKYDMNIYFVVKNKSSFVNDKDLTEKLEAYIAKNYQDNSAEVFVSNSSFADSFTVDSTVFGDFSVNKIDFTTVDKTKSVTNIFESENDINESDSIDFTKVLKTTLKKYKAKDSKIYKKSNIEKFAFARFKNNSDYKPKKEAVLGIAVALEMSLDETKNFLKQSGYEFSDKNKSDVIVKYFIENKIYNIFTINQMLFHFGESQLGALV